MKQYLLILNNSLENISLNMSFQNTSYFIICDMLRYSNNTVVEQLTDRIYLSTNIYIL